MTLIGSRAGCKINLQHPNVAPVHAAIVHTGSRLLACDLATVRGARLNGLPLELEELAEGDALVIGPWEFRVELMPPMEPDGQVASLMNLEPAPGEFVFEHTGTHRLFQPKREVCVIGRRSKCDIAIDDAEVSRVHAMIFRYHEHPVVADLLGSSPLLLNDAPVALAYLHADDLLRIGATEFRVRFPRLAHLPSRAEGNGNGAGHAPRNGNGAPLPRSSGDADAGLNDDLPVAIPDEEIEDLVNIRDSEGSRWPVADHLERLERGNAAR